MSAREIVTTAAREELLSRIDDFALEPRAILNLDAGVGHASHALRARFASALTIALDRSRENLAAAQSHSQGLSPFERVAGEGARLPFAAATFDLVVGSLCHDETLDADLAEVRRVLRPSGLFLFCLIGEIQDVHGVGSAITRAGLTEPVLDVERYPEKVVFGSAWGAESASGIAGEVLVPIDRIRRRT